jgi:hypothetical protein
MLALPDIMVPNPIHSPTLEDTTMNSFFFAGGSFMYLILAIGFVAFALTLYRGATTLLRGRRIPTGAVRTILHLGVLALLLGIAAQLTGLYRAASAIIRAENISPQIVAQGILVSFNTTLFGLYILLFCLLLWLGLRALASRRDGRSAEG